MSAARTAPLTCPSAQPAMEDAQVLGIVGGSSDAPRLAYLNEHVPAAVVADAASHVPITQVLRFAAKCEEARCTHFDGRDCQLATRIVRMLAPAVDALPPCTIRRTCRWFAQEGRPACLRCPQIVTAIDSENEHLVKVSGQIQEERRAT